ncbi:hypothetical protein [Planococcus antarcticus]|nr:hypothetical protein [Planococcus antarcticus]
MHLIFLENETISVAAAYNVKKAEEAEMVDDNQNESEGKERSLVDI